MDWTAGSKSKDCSSFLCCKMTFSPTTDDDLFFGLRNSDISPGRKANELKLSRHTLLSKFSAGNTDS